MRKLLKYFELNLNSHAEFGNNTSVLSDLNNLSHHMASSHNIDTTLTVQIESAIRLKDPVKEMEVPSAFVRLRWPFDTDEKVET
jgi:hypothetical protein